jgi:hypothetical protein
MTGVVKEVGKSIDCVINNKDTLFREKKSISTDSRDKLRGFYNL